MRRLRSHIIGVDRGSVVLFSDFEDGGEMWTGHGPREMRKAIKFSEPYLDAPVLQVSMSMWDMDQKTNQRADISAEDVTPKGFSIVFRTWGDTRVARVRADWTALGAVRDDDDWDVL
ncbi:MAG: H-type lectin domain-containing protein [Paracoccaceae bacterium]